LASEPAALSARSRQQATEYQDVRPSVNSPVCGSRRLAVHANRNLRIDTPLVVVIRFGSVAMLPHSVTYVSPISALLVSMPALAG
jgi:hypothetical protein